MLKDFLEWTGERDLKFRHVIFIFTSIGVVAITLKLISHHELLIAMAFKLWYFLILIVMLLVMSFELCYRKLITSLKKIYSNFHG